MTNKIAYASLFTFLVLGVTYSTANAFPNLSGCTACRVHVSDSDLDKGNLKGDGTLALGGPAVSGAGAGQGPRGDRYSGGAGQGQAGNGNFCGACGPLTGGQFLGDNHISIGGSTAAGQGNDANGGIGGGVGGNLSDAATCGGNC